VAFQFSTQFDSDDILAGKRRALAKAITLIESSREADRKVAGELLNVLIPHAGQSLRVGISGTPGVGKSTFIETFGSLVVSQGNKLAVLAVDPSSPLAGGSILGDKTRMENLSREPNAFIRPSPSSGQLGGVAQKTREVILLCEAAGFDTILVETVGVGQSEFEVANMVDFFLVLMQPNGGDELQGIKKGILELAQALVINKADGAAKVFAEQAKAHYENALRLLRQNEEWQTRVLTCSSTQHTNIDKIWEMFGEYLRESKASGSFQARRSEQNRTWASTLFTEMLELQLAQRQEFLDGRQQLMRQVEKSEITPLDAAERLLKLI
jgi:LAO/AO transport system kinase